MIIDIVLYYCQGRGGFESVSKTVIKGLISKGHRLRFIQVRKALFKEWEDDISSLCEFYYFDNGTFTSSCYEDYLNSYKYIINKIGYPDVVIVAQSPLLTKVCNDVLNNDTSKIHIPTVSWVHCPTKYLGYGVEYLHDNEAHIAISNTIAKEISQFNPKGEIYIIGNPIKTRNVATIPRPTDKLELLSIGRIEMFCKRLDVLFYALSKLKFPYHLSIIGNGMSDDVNAAKKICDDLNISDNITWHGWRSNPWSDIKKASILISTSDFEGFSLVQLESLSRGIPVISTKVGGAPDLIKDGINGWLIDKGNYDSLSYTLNMIASGKFSLPCAENCINSVKQYDELSVINKIEQILINEVIKSLLTTEENS